MNKFTLSLLALAISTSAMADGLEKTLSKYRFGVFGSIGYSNLNPTSSNTNNLNNKYDVSRHGGKASYGFGLSAEKMINDKYSLYSGLSMEWIGGTTIANATSLADPTTYADSMHIGYSLQYLQVPLGLKLKATNIDRFQIYTQLGLDAGILVGNKASYTIKDANNLIVTEEKEKQKLGIVNPFSLAYQVGLGTEFKVTKENSAYVTILYRNGFLDHTLPGNRIDGQKYNDGNVRSNNICLRIGYYF